MKEHYAPLPACEDSETPKMISPVVVKPNPNTFFVADKSIPQQQIELRNIADPIKVCCV